MLNPFNLLKSASGKTFRVELADLFQYHDRGIPVVRKLSYQKLIAGPHLWLA
jgi:hypothetical protein